MAIEWGSVAEWVGSIATGAAFLIAAFEYRRAGRERRQKQAMLVYAVTLDDSPIPPDGVVKIGPDEEFLSIPGNWPPEREALVDEPTSDELYFFDEPRGERKGPLTLQTLLTGRVVRVLIKNASEELVYNLGFQYELKSDSRSSDLDLPRYFSTAGSRWSRDVLEPGGSLVIVILMSDLALRVGKLNTSLLFFDAVGRKWTRPEAAALVPDFRLNFGPRWPRLAYVMRRFRRVGGGRLK